MVSWPTTLPEYPLEQGFSESLPGQLLESGLENGRSTTRRRHSHRARPFTLTMALTEAQRTIFETFYDTTLDGGLASFEWVHPLYRTAQTFRFRKPAPKFSVRGAAHLVSFSLESLTARGAANPISIVTGVGTASAAGAAAAVGLSVSAAERLRITINDDDGGGWKSCATLRVLYNGVDYTYQSAGSGSAVASSTGAGSIASAVDGPQLGAGGWQSSAVPATVTWTPSSGSPDFTGMALTSPNNTLNRCPTAFVVEGSDDNFVSDVDEALSVSGITGWAALETRRWTWPSIGGKAKWRVRFTAVDGGTTVALLAIRFHDASGNATSGGTKRALSLASTSFTNQDIQYVLDANTSTGWTSGDTSDGQVITMDFAARIPFVAAANLLQVQWTSRSGEGNRSPKDYTIDLLVGASWVNVKTKTGNTGWGSLETRDLMAV